MKVLVPVERVGRPSKDGTVFDEEDLQKGLRHDTCVRGHLL